MNIHYIILCLKHINIVIDICLTQLYNDNKI